MDNGRLARRTKYEQIVGWVNGEEMGDPVSLSIQGGQLRSYGVVIAERTVDADGPIVTVHAHPTNGGAGYSKTTQKHINWIRKAASLWGVRLVDA